MRPFLYHVHGVGQFDFSNLDPGDLPAVEALAQERGQDLVPTVFLVRDNLPSLVDLLKHYDELRRAGRLPHLAGFAVEGPLLGPEGGVPREGKWVPTWREWVALAELGELGLKYIVMAPDSLALDERVDGGHTFAELLELFYDHGTRMALGHFHHDDPTRSARRTREVVAHLHATYEPSPYLVLTDHLYNDMPRTFTHAWRTPDERARRDAEVTEFLRSPWTPETVEDLLGPVPAVLLETTRDGLVTPCLNFDGLHVDIEVCRRTVEYLGAERLVALTDHIEVSAMASEKLWLDPTGLWRRQDGVVAAGSTDFEQQRANMRAVGLPEDAVEAVFDTVPRAVMAFVPRRRLQPEPA